MYVDKRLYTWHCWTKLKQLQMAPNGSHVQLLVMGKIFMMHRPGAKIFTMAQRMACVHC